MALLTEIQNADRYLPRFKLAEGSNLKDLFTSWSLHTFAGPKPDDLSLMLWLNLEGFYNGKHVYLLPSDELAALLAQLSIYGAPVRRKDIFLKVSTRADGKVYLSMQFQQIIGSYVLCELDDQMYYQLIGLHYEKGGAGAVELPTLDGCEE